MSMLLLLGVGLTPRGGSAQEPDGQEAAAPTGAIRVVTVLVTKVSADRSLTVEVFPRVAEATRGDRVFWLNAVPGAVMSVLFDGDEQAGGTCADTADPGGLFNGRVLPGPIASGKASGLCFGISGTYPYHVTLVGVEAGASMSGVLVVK